MDWFSGFLDYFKITPAPRPTHLQCVHAADVAHVVEVAHAVDAVVLGDAALLEADVEDVLAVVVLQQTLKLLDAEVTVQLERARALVTDETVEAKHAEVD